MSPALEAEYRAALEECRLTFFLEPTAVVGSWAVMAEVCRIMYTTTARGKVLNALPNEMARSHATAECVGQAIHDPVHKCHSAMFTWHSDVGLHTLR